jgi:hypothetical protein
MTWPLPWQSTPCPPVDTTQAPVLLWSSDLRSATPASLPTSATATDIDGQTMTVSAPVGTPTEWAIVDGVGIEVGGSGVRGRLTISWAQIAANMSRALTDLDGLIIEFQVGDEVADGSLSANDSGVFLSVVSSSGTNYAIANMTRYSGARERQVGRYTGGATPETGSLRENATGRSFSLRIGPGGYSAIGYTTDAELGFSAPMTSASSRRMVAQNAGTGTAAGPWSNQSVAYLLLDLVKSSGETAAIVLEQMAIWLVPGTTYTP